MEYLGWVKTCYCLILAAVGFLSVADAYSFRHLPHIFFPSQKFISRNFRPVSLSLSLQKETNEADSVSISDEAFVESFELQNWGLFDHSVLTLGSQPLFAVITGETGSGKSVFISALQYLYSTSGNNYQYVSHIILLYCYSDVSMLYIPKVGV